MQTPPPVDAEARARVMAYAGQLPFLVRCGFVLRDCEPGRAQASLTITEELAGLSGHLNGTELYGLLDCTAWFAVALLLGPEEAAVTHDAHFSILSTAPTGSEVSLSAWVDKRGRSVVFATAEARVGDRLVARGTVTKSVVALSQRMRHATASKP